MIKKVEIQDVDLEFIMGEDYESELNVCMNSLRVSCCKKQYQAKIANYHIFLNEWGDIMLDVYVANVVIR